MTDMVSVPAEKIAALREAREKHEDSRLGMEGLIVEKAFDLLDAVETEDEPPQHPQFEAFKAERLKDPEIKAAYDEARARNDVRDDAENRCMHADLWGVVAVCGCQIVPAAHMDAPDELTALREELAAERRRKEFWKANYHTPVAERDALRERVRELADEWENYECECENADTAPYCLHRSNVFDFGRMLRAVLGDA